MKSKVFKRLITVLISIYTNSSNRGNSMNCLPKASHSFFKTYISNSLHIVIFLLLSSTILRPDNPNYVFNNLTRITVYPEYDTLSALPDTSLTHHLRRG